MDKDTMALHGLSGSGSPIQDSIDGQVWPEAQRQCLEPRHHRVHQVDTSGIPAVNLRLDDLSVEGAVGEEPIGGG